MSVGGPICVNVGMGTGSTYVPTSHTSLPPSPPLLSPPPLPFLHSPPPPHRSADVTLKLKLFADQLSQVSELLTQIVLPEDGSPITLEWMKTRQNEIGIERTKVFGEKRLDSNKLTKHKEMVLSELEKLRVLNRQHRKLMVEVWTHLTSLARVSGCGEGRGVW